MGLRPADRKAYAADRHERLTWKLALWDCLSHYQAEKEYLTNILKHTSGHDSFVHYMTEIHCQEASLYIRQRTGKKFLDA